ncbi:MAG: LamG domain-containing protein [Kiritimatiellaeota bacterium]|nr:LamG domain-containing protein [Kiritimatiellota bacterium]
MQEFLSVFKRAIPTVVVGCALAASAAQPVVRLRLAASLTRGPDAEQSAGCGEALCRVDSKVGGFWRVKGSDNVLAWLAAGNLNKAHGTLAFRFRPGWPADDHAQRLLFADSRNFSVKGDNALRLWIVRWDKSYLRFDMRSREDRYITVPLERIPPGKWHHLTATWDSSEGIRLFVDGRPAGKRDYTYEPKPPGDILRLGGGEAGLEPGLGDYRDLVILDRALTADEVTALAKGEFRAHCFGACRAAARRAGAPDRAAASRVPCGLRRLVGRGRSWRKSRHSAAAERQCPIRSVSVRSGRLLRGRGRARIPGRRQRPAPARRPGLLGPSGLVRADREGHPCLLPGSPAGPTRRRLPMDLVPCLQVASSVRPARSAGLLRVRGHQRLARGDLALRGPDMGRRDRRFRPVYRRSPVSRRERQRQGLSAPALDAATETILLDRQPRGTRSRHGGIRRSHHLRPNADRRTSTAPLRLARSVDAPGPAALPGAAGPSAHRF